jgi:hypothetical protein
LISLRLKGAEIQEALCRDGHAVLQQRRRERVSHLVRAAAFELGGLEDGVETP